LIEYVIHTDTHKYRKGEIIEEGAEARELLDNFPLCIGRIEVPDATAKAKAKKTIQNEEPQ